MAKFQRGGRSAPTKEAYSVGLNIVLSGSKRMTEPQIEALLSTASVHVRIESEDGRSLVDETVHAKQFSTGSVGFGLNIRGAMFT